jgi:hypothetical protein
MTVGTKAVSARPALRTLLAGTRNVRWAHIAAGAVILLAFVALHIVRLGSTPGWDPQEGYNLDFAWNLAHGRYRLFALAYGFAQHPPLFYAQLIVAIRIFGYSIVAVRALSVLYAVLTCAALMLAVARMAGPRLSLWAGAAFTLAPLILANTRWGYTYAQLALFGVLCLWAAWEYTRHQLAEWLVAATLLAGLAAASDYEGVAWVVFVALVVARYEGWRRGLRALALACVIPAISIGVSALVAPASTRADWADTFLRASSGNLLIAVIELLVNYYRFLISDPWIVLGVAGLFLLERKAARDIVLAAFALLALVVLKVREIGVSVHSAVPLLPFIALGAGAALDRGLRTLYTWGLEWWTRARSGILSPDLTKATPSRTARTLSALLVAVAIVAPVGIALATDVVGVNGSLTTRQDAILGNPRDASAVAAYIQAHAHGGDLVLASPEIAWMFDQPEHMPAKTRGADVLQTVASSGAAASFYPRLMPASRFTFDVHLTSARYVVVDNLVRRLAQPDEVDGLVPLLRTVQSWPAVFSSGQYTVYERPGGA